MERRIFTVGHSTRTTGQFIDLLAAHGVQVLADVRRFPASRRHPHFNAGEMASWLTPAGIAYLPCPELGGHRTPRPPAESPNLGWDNESFRGYADYMLTDDFRQAIDHLCTHAVTAVTAVMCAEAVPWRCHRSLLSDALLVRGWTVAHIMDEQRANPHALRDFASVRDGRLTYPAPADGPGSLFADP